MSFWVLGTDTGVGKTAASAIILSRHDRAPGPAYWKPVATGRSEERDLETVRGLAPPGAVFIEEAYLFDPPVSPHLAARRAGVPIRLERILEDLEAHRRRFGPLLIEGAGGLMVPLTDDGDLLIDLVAQSGLPAALVARSALGTINHTLLSLEALRARDIEIAGVIINGPPEPENAAAIERFGKAAVIGVIEPLQLSREAFARAARHFDAAGILLKFLGP